MTSTSAVARLLSLLLAWACAVAASAQTRFDFDTTPGRLSKDILPTRYALTLDLDPARDHFSGEASITLQVRRAAAAIVVHANGLEVSRATLGTANGGPSRALLLVVDAAAQTLALTPADGAPVAAGEHRLELAWLGKVQQSGQALFRAESTQGVRKLPMLATQGSAIFARMVFPAFDEPAFRSVFELSVRAPKALDVVSNMPAANISTEADARLHRFEPTPAMPSYLLALAVGRFDKLEARAAGVPLRILTAPGKREHARYAMQATQRLLPYYNAYFGLPYMLPKLDQLAVPSTRDGAMEDWGLISYIESALLFDPASSSPDTQRTVFNIVAHELSHQWFGNLVTAASWQEIWLNEAFATWIQVKATQHFNPQWQVRASRRPTIDSTMARDAGNATRAIRSGPVGESSVFDVFDSITYTKGGAVLAMLEQWIGVEPFRRGLAAYMQERKYSNATAGDLWHHIGAAAGRDVAAVASSWTDQPGFPLLQLQVRCDGQRTMVIAKQQRFTAGAAAASPNALWKIPLRLARGADTTTVLLERAEQTFDLPGCNSEPLIANVGGEGFYRTEYEPAHLRALAGRFTVLPSAARVTLLSDSFALAQAGRVPMAAYFDLLAALPRVDDASRSSLLSLAGTSLGFLDTALAGTPAQARLRDAGRALLAPQLAALGWAPRRGDSAETLKLRGTLIEQLARFDDARVIGRTRKLFDGDEAGRAALPASIRSSVITAVGVHADGARFDRLLSRLKASASEEDRELYLGALAAGRDASRAEALLALSLAGIVGPNTAAAIPQKLGESSPFGELAYGFTLANWPRLAEMAGNNFGASGWLLPGAAWNFNDADRIAGMLDDQRRIAGAEGATAAARAADRIAMLAAVKRRDARELERLLEGWKPAP